MSCCNNNCYNPCGSTCYRTNYNNCCVPQQPCTSTVIKFPTTLTTNAFTVATSSSTIITISGSNISANWLIGGLTSTAAASTATGGGGGLLCCCPCSIDTSLVGSYTTGTTIYNFSAPLVITIAGGTATASGNITYVNSAAAATTTGTINFTGGTVTCCNGIRTVTFATAGIMTGLV